MQDVRVDKDGVFKEARIANQTKSHVVYKDPLTIPSNRCTAVAGRSKCAAKERLERVVAYI